MELLEKVPADLQGDVLLVAVQQARASGNKSGVRSLLELALRSDHVVTAARLMHNSPDPEFFGRVFEAILHKLAAAGFKVGQKSLTIDIEKVELAGAAAEANKRNRTLLAHEMVTALLILDKPRCVDVALSIIQQVDANPRQQQAFILELCRGLGLELENLRETMLNALPGLCTKHVFELEIILEMDEGKRLIAQAVVDYLLRGNCNRNIVALFFEKFASRVPLLDALPNIETTLERWPPPGGKIRGVAPGQPLTDMIAIAKALEGLKLTFDRSQTWIDGWRSLGVIVLAPDEGRAGYLADHAYPLLAAKLIDRAASIRPEEALDLLPSLDRETRSQELLADMIGKGLFSGDAFAAFMLSLVSRLVPLVRMIDWIGGAEAPHVRRVIYAEMARVLVDLPEEHFVAANFAAQAIHRSDVFDEVRKEIDAIDKEWWTKFLGKFPRT